jgi:uncharacterized protein
MFAIEDEKYKELIAQDFTSLSEKRPHFFSAMIKTGIIVPCDFNEIDFIKTENRRIVFSNYCYRLTLNPTLECNFKCWYCYEKHVQGKMDNKLLKSIEKHVKYKIEEEGIKRLELDWFGGEPFLYFNEIVYPLSLKIKKLCKLNDVEFAHSSTTNGYLLDIDRIRKLKEIQMNNFQITLDGNEKLHDKIRYDKDTKKSYKKIIENMNLLAENNDCKISLRINFTKKTLETIKDISNDISDKSRNKVEICFQQVWQDSFKKNISSADIEKEFMKLGFAVERSRLNEKYYTCYADLNNQAVINYDGNVFKCTARDFANTKPCGTLQSTGIIDWDKSKIYARMCRATFENKFCLKCFYLPLCKGPCSQKMLETKSDADFRKYCYKGGIKETINKKIEDFVLKSN